MYYLHENIDKVTESLELKRSSLDISSLLELDSQRRQYLQEVAQLRAEKNKGTSAISDLKKKGENAKEDI